MSICFASEENDLYDPETNSGGWQVYDQPLFEVLNTAIIHHSVLPFTDGPLQIQYKHIHRGLADIGYHFVIDANGQVYEGRNINIRGAHAGGHNTGTIGVVLLGNFAPRPWRKSRWRNLFSATSPPDTP